MEIGKFIRRIETNWDGDLQNDFTNPNCLIYSFDNQNTFFNFGTIDNNCNNVELWSTREYRMNGNNSFSFKRNNGSWTDEIEILKLTSDSLRYFNWNVAVDLSIESVFC